ncbi:MAG TPA: ROK family protein [Polyangia bacterium]|nr:ROK family protein [Polyangia bacterium]
MKNGTGLVVGVDLGGTKMHAAAVDEHGRVLGEARCKTLPDEGAGAVIERIAKIVRDAVKASSHPLADVQAVCVGVPGGVDAHTGIVDRAPNLGWEHVPLGPELSAALGGVRVFLDNDVRVAVLGEFAYGVGRGAQTMVGVFVGTGIGGGVVVGGRLHLGARGAAGEIGHMCLDPSGPRCPCGRIGCAEALASRTSIERDVRALVKRGRKSKVLKLMAKENRPRLTSSVIARALADGDKVMRKVMARAQFHLGLLVGNLVNALDPEVVVIGGGIAERLGEDFVTPIRAGARERFLVERDADHVRIVPTQLKDQAAPLGAAFVARQRLGLVHARTTDAPKSAP